MTPMMTISERCRAVAHTLDLEGLYTQAAVVEAAADRIELLVTVLKKLDQDHVGLDNFYRNIVCDVIAKAEAPLS